MAMNVSQNNTGVSFDINHDRNFILKLSQEGIQAHKLSEEVDQYYKFSTKFKRPLQLHGPFKDVIRCAPSNYLYAYSDRSNVVIGGFSDAGFIEQQSLLDQMSRVNSIDWMMDGVQIVSGSQDDIALLWDAETLEYIRRFKGNSAASKINLVAVSKRNYNLFATCHDRDIKIWDKRGTNPVEAYSGHCNRITHLDWSPHEHHFFLTCSLDKTVKLWDWKNKKVPVSEKRLSEQVWRALYDPLGCRNAFLALTVPDDKQNGVAPLMCEFYKDTNCDVPLQNRSEGLIIEARVSSKVAGNTTLIGLSSTGQFKTWVLDSLPTSSRLNLSLNLTSPTEYKDAKSGFELPTLASSPNSSSVLPSSCDVVQNTERFGIIVQSQEKLTYFKSQRLPVKLKMDTSMTDVPSFSFEDFPLSLEKKGTYLKHFEGKAQEILLETGANTEKLINFVCNDFRELCNEIEEDISVSSRKTRTNFDKHVPFPRICGARFCSNNYLVVFKRPLFIDETGVNSESVRQKTFRAYHEMLNTKISVLTGKKRDKTPSTPSVSEYYYPTSTRTRQTRAGHSESHQRSYISPVQIRDVSRAKVLPSSCKQLAEEYCLDPDSGDLGDICSRNIEVARGCRRPDLVQLWSALKETTNPRVVKYLFEKKLWDAYPYNRKLIDSYIKMYFYKKDVQTLAMIYGMCNLVEKKVKKILEPELSNFQFIPPGNMLFSVSDNLPTMEQESSEAESDTTTSPTNREETGCYEGLPETSGLNGDLIKLNYAAVLYNWDLLNRRAEILKTVTTEIRSVHGQTLHTFERAGRGWDCAVCRLPVTNLGSFCLKCFHGGHHQHLRAWFTSQPLGECPTGCGCLCSEVMGEWGL